MIKQFFIPLSLVLTIGTSAFSQGIIQSRQYLKNISVIRLTCRRQLPGRSVSYGQTIFIRASILKPTDGQATRFMRLMMATYRV